MDFSAAWCAPCKALAPTLEKLQESLPDVRIVTVDIDTEPRLAARFGVRSVPTLVLLRQGQVAKTRVGNASLGALQAWVQA